MGIIIDIILVAIFALNIFICYKKGLVKLAVGLIAFFASIVIAFALFKPISNIVIENTEFDEKIESSIIENFTTEVEENNEENSNVLEYFQKIVDDSVNKSKNQIVTEAAKVISVKAIEIATLIVLFIVARIAFILLTLIADIITKLPILKQFNEAGGIIYGIIKGLIIIYVVLAIVFLIVSVTGNTKIADAIDSTFITKMFYNYNLILKIIF